MISVYTPTRICQKFEEKHGMRHLKLHGLRHTFGSIMIAMGTDPETVRDMMGHDSVKTTDIYLHPYDVNKKRPPSVSAVLLKEIKMQLMTLQKAVDKIRAYDPNTAVNFSMLSRLVGDGMIPYEKHGNRTIIDYDRLVVRLKDALDVDPADLISASVFPDKIMKK